jgi:hypothetical protein
MSDWGGWDRGGDHDHRWGWGGWRGGDYGADNKGDRGGGW